MGESRLEGQPIREGLHRIDPPEVDLVRGERELKTDGFHPRAVVLLLAVDDDRNDMRLGGRLLRDGPHHPGVVRKKGAPERLDDSRPGISGGAILGNVRHH